MCFSYESFTKMLDDTCLSGLIFNLGMEKLIGNSKYVGRAFEHLYI